MFSSYRVVLDIFAMWSRISVLDLLTFIKRVWSNILISLLAYVPCMTSVGPKRELFSLVPHRKMGWSASYFENILIPYPGLTL